MADRTIVDWAPYSQHIPLKCKNHPDLRWHTKNIGSIGERSIFFSDWQHMENECKCSLDDLVPLTHEEALAEGWKD